VKHWLRMLLTARRLQELRKGAAQGALHCLPIGSLTPALADGWHGRQHLCQYRLSQTPTSGRPGRA